MNSKALSKNKAYSFSYSNISKDNIQEKEKTKKQKESVIHQTENQKIY